MAVALVNQGLSDISIKLPEPKAFYGDHKQARAQLSAAYRYFTAVGLDKDEQAHSVWMTNICCTLMQGNAAWWMDHLEALEEAPSMFREFQEVNQNKYLLLDDANTAWDKLRTTR